jgi:hypothetical protein
VGTEVAVVVHYKASASRIEPLLGDHRLAKAQEPSSSGPAANMRVRKLTVEEVGPMTGDLSEPAHGAAQQAYEAAARLYEQAAAELDRAVAHCRVAATHFRGAEVPRGAAHAWAALGHLREAELRLEEQARTHRLKARL